MSETNIAGTTSTLADGSAPGISVPPNPADDLARKQRIAELTRQRDVIDREIAWLRLTIGENGRPWRHCQRCGYDWQSIAIMPPRICPRCKRQSWDRPRVRGSAVRKVASPPGPGKKRVGRPTNIERDNELRTLREKVATMDTSAPTALVTRTLDYPSAPEYDVTTALPPLPPPPRSLSAELALRRVPVPEPVPEPEPVPNAEPPEIEPDIEPAEDPSDAR